MEKVVGTTAKAWSLLVLSLLLSVFSLVHFSCICRLAEGVHDTRGQLRCFGFTFGDPSLHLFLFTVNSLQLKAIF